MRFTRTRSWTLAVLLGAFALSSSTASATTATVGPSTPESVTMTWPGGARFVFADGGRVICTSWGGTGSLNSASGTLPIAIGSLTPTFTSCTRTGGVSVTISCAAGTLSVTGLTSGGVTPIVLAMSCTIRVSAPVCQVTVAGQVTGRYNTGALTLSAAQADQTLNTGTSNTCATLFTNNTAVRFENSSGGNAVANLVVTGGSTIPTVTVV